MLDLNLTGEQILNRNRVEGFSNISESEAADVQISVRAELIQNTLGQLQNEQNPKMVEQLRNSLLAAAFKGMIANLPDGERQKYASILQPVGGVLGGMPGVGGDLAMADTDGGAGKSLQANQNKTAAETAFSQLKRECAKYPPPGNDPKLLAAAQLLIEQSAKAVIDNASQVASKSVKAVADARDLRSIAAKQFTLSKSTLESVPKALEEAREKADKAEALAGELTAAARQASQALDSASGLDKDRSVKAWADSVLSAVKPIMEPEPTPATASTASASQPATKPEPASPPTPPTPQNVAAAASSASEAARAAAGSVGVISKDPKTPDNVPEQKIFEPPPLPAAENRLALKRARDFKEPLANPEGPFNVNMQQLLALTGSDKSLLSMLQWNSFPTNYGPGSRVYLCMASVNVVPGRKTYEGYMGQVNVALRYGLMHEQQSQNRSDANAKKSQEWEREIKPIEGDARPSAVSVFPLVNAQVLDLRSSRRQVFTLAVQLMLSGYPIAANALFDYMKQFEQDALTLTALNSVASYGNGPNIGFTFSPNYWAQQQLNKPQSKPGLRMQPWSFPIIVLITCDERVFSNSGRTRPTNESASESADLSAATAAKISDYVGTFLDQNAANLQAVTASMSAWKSRQFLAPSELASGRITSSRIHPLAGAYDSLRIFVEAIRPVAIRHHPDAYMADLDNDLWSVVYDNFFQAATSYLKQQRSGALTSEQASQLRDQLVAMARVNIDKVLRKSVLDATSESDGLIGPRYLLWNQTHRWMRADYSLNPFARHQNEYLKLTNLKSLLNEEQARTPPDGIGKASYAYNAHLSTRIEYLRDMAYGTTVPLRLPVFDSSTKLPEFVTPKINVSPTRGWVNRESTFFVTHNNQPFTGDYLVTVGGKRVNATKLSNGVLRVTVPPWMDTFDRKAAQELTEGDSNKSRFKAKLAVTDGVQVFESGEIDFDYWAPTPDVSTLADPGVDLGIHLPDAVLVPKDVHVEREKTVNLAVALSRPVSRLLSGTLIINFAAGDPIKVPLNAENSQRLAPRDPDIKASDFFTPESSGKPAAARVVKGLDLTLTLKRGESLQIPVSGDITVEPVASPATNPGNAPATNNTTRPTTTSAPGGGS